MPTPATHLTQPSIARRVVLDGFAPVPRGVIPTVPSNLVWPAKDPGDVLDYEFDISAAVIGDCGDSIATIDVAITPNASGDLTMNSAAASGDSVVLWLAAGQPSTNYAVQITVGTANGRTINRTVLLPVQSLASTVVPSSALTTEQGVVVTDQNGNPILVGS
ncbi:MAG TPA: hypothetical protein VHS58_18690 [Acetobacteraceae bacterium]|jgi:hypothetical protein|nr:hypothetical protein [Acetobacteraceae bacterium]